MEELPKSVRFKKVSFKTQHHKIEKLEDICHSSRPREIWRKNEIETLSSSYQSLEPEAAYPVHAMEFLSRSWSPLASDFLQMLSPKDQSLPLKENNSSKEHDDMVEIEGKERETAAQSNTSTVNGVDSISAWVRSQISIHPNLLMHESPDSNPLKYLKKWLREKSLSSFLGWNKEKKKEENRLRKSQLHAALSVARLAAAVTGFVANIIVEGQDIKHMVSEEGDIECDKNIGIVVATAAALIASVCAEAAESAGADKARVTNIVNSGLASQTPTDIIALTANAATCLRGAATLKSRSAADTYSPKNQELVRLGAKLSVLKSSGHREHRWVSIFLKRRQLLLSLRMNYLGGMLTTSKEYVIEETKEAKGHNLISLKTNNGDIKLLFGDETQLIVWLTTISNLLRMRNSI